ncbi:hypothetical protein FQA39_LY13912 [Lamprigera yunnana]|nr:hypothetical protein FQA39_LY13912 [Lamprigera yunnana]
MELEDCDDLLQNFKGGTLELNSEDAKTPSSEHDGLLSDTDNNSQSRWENSITAIPQLISQKVLSRTDTTKNVCVKPTLSVLLQGNANDFFIFRQGIIEQAINECVECFLNDECEESLWTVFLLTEISLWDTEKERLVLITPKNMVVIKYDFIALRKLDHKIIPLKNIDTVLIGDLVYPTTSIVPKRNMHGVRFMWNKGKPLNFGNKWNPLCKDVPFITFTSHPLYFHKECTNDNQKKVYCVAEFIDSMLPSLNNDGANYLIHHKDILMENYIGIGSLIHNRNGLGFFKVRGRFSF